MQLKAMLRLRVTLARRELRTILASILIPVIMVGIAIGMSAGIQSGIPKLDPSPLATRPLVNPAALPDTAAIAVVLPKASDAQRAAVSASLLATFRALGKPGVSLVPFGSLEDYQDSLSRFYRGFANASLIPASFAIRDTIATTPDADGKLPFKYELLIEDTQQKDLEPLMVFAAENVKQALLQQTGAVIFNPILTLFDNPGFFFDVSLTIIPSFLSYGFTYMIPYYTTSKVDERERGHRDYLFTMGLAPLMYYTASFVVDFAVYLLNVVVGSIILQVFRVKAFTETNYLLWFLPMFLFGPMCILLSYCLAFLFRKQETAGMVLGFGMAIVVFVPYFFTYFVFNNVVSMNVIYGISAALPTYGLYQAFNQIGTATIGGQPFTIASLLEFSYNPVLIISLLFVAQTLIAALVLATLVHMDLSNTRSFFAAAATVVGSLFGGDSHSGKTKTANDGGSDNQTAVLVSDASAHAAKDAEVQREMARIADPSTAGQDAVRIAGMTVEFTKPAPKDTSKWFSPATQERFTVLDDLWLAVRRNECFAYLGPNGCGKTTTIKTLIGLVRPTAGSASVGSYSILPQYDRRARSIIGICPQFDVVWDKMSPREHLELLSMVRGNDPSDAAVSRDIDDLMAEVGLAPFRDTFVGELSGGNKRKVSLAAACLGNPEIIFMDEPTTGVDVAIRRSIWSIIEKVKKRASVILTTHSMERGGCTQRPHRHHGQRPPAVCGHAVASQGGLRVRLQGQCQDAAAHGRCSARLVPWRSWLGRLVARWPPSRVCDCVPDDAECGG
ncbi:hypothetical protein BC831DRAFT_112867 [Entophlyctis helioformis]|nr:hypothetical protein BC831DRAFT_112867 [Entophlyctis helioformis]